MRALIVDDLASMRHFLTMCLAEFPELEFEQAEDGAEALRHLAAHPFDLVLLDVAMPVIDGLKVLAHIRAQDGAAAPTPVIVMTARTDSATRAKVQQLKAMLMPKPVRAQELRNVIRRLLDLPLPPEPAAATEPTEVHARFGDEPPAPFRFQELNALGVFLVSKDIVPVGRNGVVSLRVPGRPTVTVDARVVHVRRRDLSEELPQGFAVQFVPANAEISGALARVFAPTATTDVAELRMRASLRRMPVFRDLSEGELDLLLKLVSVVEVSGDAVVLEEGQPSDALYVVKSGAVKIVKGDPPQELAVLREGDFFGEMGVLLGAPRLASVIALQPTAMYRIRGEDFFALLRSHRPMREKIRATMINRYAANVDAVFAEAIGEAP